MDPKTIAVLRKLFNLDEKSLPDSMTSEEFGKFIDDQKGKLFGNPEDIKNLQKIISDKDVNLKKALEDVKKYKPKDTKDPPPNPEIKKLTETVVKLTETISVMANEKEIDNLKKSYPDIVPEMLVGRTKEEVKKTVEQQRKINKRIYGDSMKFHLPNYESEEDVDKEIEEVKKDKEMGGESSAVEVLKLGRAKANL